jgi:hypothetical protein
MIDGYCILSAEVDRQNIYLIIDDELPAEYLDETGNKVLLGNSHYSVPIKSLHESGISYNELMRHPERFGADVDFLTDECKVIRKGSNPERKPFNTNFKF